MTKLESALENYRNARSGLKSILDKDGVNLIGKMFQKVLKKCHGIAVYWNQYVPSFNDGEPCRFSVGDFYVIDNTDYEEIGGSAYAYDVLDSDGEIKEDLTITDEQHTELCEIFSKLDDYLLETVFGSNAEIIIDSEKVTVNAL